jgi:hypothetical protein
VPDALLIIFQQLAAGFLLIENGLVNLSESLANPTVKVLELSVWFQSLADGMQDAIILTRRSGAQRGAP